MFKKNKFLSDFARTLSKNCFYIGCCAKVVRHVRCPTIISHPAIPVLFAQIAREADVSTFIGIEGPEMFKTILEMLKPKAQVMIYWDGQKKTLRLCKRANLAQLTQTLLSSAIYNLDPLLLPISNDGPARKLSLEQELLLTLMKIRLNLLNDDLACRFQISNDRISQILYHLDKIIIKGIVCSSNLANKTSNQSNITRMF